jgi:hypothetical protein
VYSIVKLWKEELARDFQMLLDRHFSLMSESINSAVSNHYNCSKPGVPLTSEVADGKGVSANVDGSEDSSRGDIPIVDTQGTNPSDVAVDKVVSENADGSQANSVGDTDPIVNTQGTTVATITGKSVGVGGKHRCKSQALEVMEIIQIDEQSDYVCSPPNSEKVARNQSPKGTIDQMLLGIKSKTGMSSALIDKHVVFDQTPITSRFNFFVIIFYLFLFSVLFEW